jgi:hypothetical protein
MSRLVIVNVAIVEKDSDETTGNGKMRHGMVAWQLRYGRVSTAVRRSTFLDKETDSSPFQGSRRRVSDNSLAKN